MPVTDAAPTILVVEDEYTSLEVLVMLLEAKGYTVLAASDGEEALALLGTHAVDLVITDYMMPKMNGAVLCEELQKDNRLRKLPVIMMSANHPDDVPTGVQVTTFFGKPLLFDELLDAVRRLIGAPEPVHKR